MSDLGKGATGAKPPTEQPAPCDLGPSDSTGAPSAATDRALSLLFDGRSITEIKGFRRFLIDWRTLGFLWACELWEKRRG